MAFLINWSLDGVTILASLLHLLVIARAITRPNRTPASRVAWVAVITFLPWIGLIAYLLLGETSIGRERVRRLRETIKGLARPDGGSDATDRLDEQARPLSELIRSINGFTPVSGNRIRLLGDPAAPASEPKADCNAAIATLVADIEQAAEQVHVCFYIWLDDGNGGRVADAIAAAARRGVQCRVMVDALGSRSFVHGPRWAQLRDAGVHVHAMLDDIPRLGNLAVGRVDLRNHRKIVVIDNRIAYCGSQNCADPEFRTEARFAPWIDILFRCEGPIVRQEQSLFLSSWIAETGEALQALPAAAPQPPTFDDGVVAQMFGTGPTTAGNAMSDAFVAALTAAREELIVTTPYFVPDEALSRALCAAPRRGVRTTIIFPARNNSWLVGCCCRSSYPALLEAGVTIHEYPLGLLHAKSVTIDGRLALVGSANMDRRSLQLNFENNLLIADEPTTAAVRKRQLGYLSVSREVRIDEVSRWSIGRRLVQNTIGMMAPVL